MSATSLDLELAHTRVHRLLRNGRSLEAATLAEQTIRHFPRSPDAWHLLAVASDAAGRDAEAEVAARAGLTYAVDHPGLWLTLGDVAGGTDRPNLAARCYRRAADLDTQNSLPWVRTALVLRGQQRYARALRACRRARTRGHPDPDELHVLEERIRELAAGSRRRIGVARLWPAAAALVLGTAGWATIHLGQGGQMSETGRPGTVTTVSIPVTDGAHPQADAGCPAELVAARFGGQFWQVGGTGAQAICASVTTTPPSNAADRSAAARDGARAASLRRSQQR